MALYDLPRPEFLSSGEKARLIPSVADTSRECRITSILLSTMMSVEEFGKGILNSLGVRTGKTSKIQGFTEIVFKGDPQNRIRPDGLLIVKTGNKEWRAIVECKIGKAELNQQQIEAYLDLCREHGIDAVITVSNHSVADSSHHPLPLNKVKLRNVAVYHWSWMYLITEAIMWTKHHGIADPDQGYILSEFVRYLQHPSSGIMAFDRMCPEWKDVCGTIQSGMPVSKGSPGVIECVSSWHQFVRSLSLEMSVALGHSVTVPLKREYLQEPQKRLSDDCQSLAVDHILEAEFDIPNAASRIKFCADFKRRTVRCTMRLKAPEDRVRARARINWLFNQIKNVPDDNLLVRVVWPFRTPDTFSTLGVLKTNLDAALTDKTTAPPTAFEIILTRDLMARFKGSQTFVQDTQGFVLEFYEKVGQHLREWVAPPPKVRTMSPEKVIDGTDDVLPDAVPDESVSPHAENLDGFERMGEEPPLSISEQSEHGEKEPVCSETVTVLPEPANSDPTPAPIPLPPERMDVM